MEKRYIIENTIVPHTTFEMAKNRIAQCFKYADNSLEPICIAIIGESRTGKTRNLEESSFKYKQIRTENGLEVPILKVKTPSKPTVKGLVELMLMAIGDPKYYAGTENVKTIRLKKLIKLAKTKMIMIDEFQHFFDKSSHKIMHHVADWLKILVDDCKVALVIAGLPSCKDVIHQNEQLAGRFTKPIIMPRFKWSNQDDQEEFIAILSAFYDAISEYFNIPDISCDEYAFRFYFATRGLMGLLTKLLRQSIWNALDKNCTTITLTDINQAYEESTWSYLPNLNQVSPFSKEFNIIPDEKIHGDIEQISMEMA